MEKEKLIKIAKKLHQEAFDANAYYLIMQQYKECHSRYINELNISPAFYSVVYEALQKACFMEVAKLFDKTRDAFSIGDFLETCKNNEKIFLECKEFIEYTCDGQDYKDEVPYQHILKEDEKIFFKDEVKYQSDIFRIFGMPESSNIYVNVTFHDLLDLYIKKINSLKKVTENIRMQRNKVYAHNDKIEMIDESIVDQNPITYPQIKQAIECALDITSMVLGILEGTQPAKTYSNIDDLENTLMLVKKGEIYQKQEEEKELLDIKEMALCEREKLCQQYLQKIHTNKPSLDSPTIVVMTDRIDLDDQLYTQFSQCADFLRQTPVQAESKEHLKSLLNGRSANGIIFTTMFKFERGEKPLSQRRNIVVMADEAHRGQYGFDEKIVISENEAGEKEARAVVGNARVIHDALPNATFIGFTGTPISSKDRNTREVFGDYIDIYDMTQAVEDGATRPVYYESRVVHLKLDQNTLALIDSTYDVLEHQSDSATIEKSKKMLGQMESVLGADSTIESLCGDIVVHYEKYRANLLTGKAMIVAYSRTIAMKIYRQILKMRPTWKEKIGVVMTGGNNDPEDWKEIIGTKAHKEELARKFKDNDDPMKIAIVVDMWLTGFDVPSLATMYIYKPMHGYNLMQAIARVNRVFKDKEGGLIVDYVGIASALKAAMKEYTKRDQSKYGDMNIAKVAYPKFQEKLQVCKDLLHGFDFSGFFGGTPLVMAKLITGGVNFVLDARAPHRKELFLKEAMLLKQANSLCSSLTTEQERHEAAYMEAVRSTVVKITYSGSGGKSLSLKEINAQINELLKSAVQSEGVINLFDSSKTGENFSLFDPAVLDEISRMKEKNIAVEILKKLMAEQVSMYKRTNVVQSQKFSEKITQLMNSYYNGLITNEEVIKELLKTAEEITNLYKSGQKLGLTQEELAFYDALTKPEHIKDFYQNDQLIALTKELTEMLRKNRTIDWQKKETARATMRKMVKRLLKKYDYPPEDYDFAISTVISQCELWTDNVDTSVSNIGQKREKLIYSYPMEEHLDMAAEPNHYMKN